jgi:hypothetical protein
VDAAKGQKGTGNGIQPCLFDLSTSAPPGEPGNPGATHREAHAKGQKGTGSGALPYLFDLSTSAPP